MRQNRHYYYILLSPEPNLVQLFQFKPEPKLVCFSFDSLCFRYKQVIFTFGLVDPQESLKDRTYQSISVYVAKFQMT